MNHEPSLSELQKKWHGTFRSYVIGFIASLLLTGAAFFIVWMRLFSGEALILTIVVLALAQALIQLIFFLHLGKESKPRWEMTVFLFMAMVLFIIVLGSLWIMYDLNDRVMSGMPVTPPKGNSL